MLPMNEYQSIPVPTQYYIINVYNTLNSIIYNNNNTLTELSLIKLSYLLILLLMVMYHTCYIDLIVI